MEKISGRWRFIGRVETEEIKERLPNLYREQTKNGIIATITIISKKAISVVYEFKGGQIRLIDGSRCLAKRTFPNLR